MDKTEKQKQELECKQKEALARGDAIALAAATVELHAFEAMQQKKAQKANTKHRTDENDFFLKPTIQAKPLMIGGFRFRI